MDKPAETSVHIYDILDRRRSPVAFEEQAIEADELTAVFETARWAPLCYNTQSWRLIVAAKENAGAYDSLLQCLVDANIEWARSAPALALSVARVRFEHNNKPNRYALHEVGLT